jgi:hypothetical protein
MATSKYLRWTKPLKRSQKVKLRKELERRRIEEQYSTPNPNFQNGQWEISWERVKEMF